MLLAATISLAVLRPAPVRGRPAWARNGEWKRDNAALMGKRSHYDLPPLLRWFTANIGIHHVHHLSSRIPFYRLSKVLC